MWAAGKYKGKDKGKYKGEYKGKTKGKDKGKYKGNYKGKCQDSGTQKREGARLRPGSVSEGFPGGFREQRYSAVLNGAQHGARVQNDGAQRCSKERTVKSSFIYLPN